MNEFSPRFGISTLVNCVGERQDPINANVAPIYQTSVFGFPDFARLWWGWCQTASPSLIQTIWACWMWSVLTRPPPK